MNPDLAVKYPVGSLPAISFVPYIIFCSYLVSLIGAFTTVELLHRRVSGSGWRSWVQVGGCAVSFGLVAIWCMHFVGNRAIILGDGEAEIQLYYSPSYTAVSAILPVVVIFLGLLIADKFYRNTKRPLTRNLSLIVCGVCAGAAVTEMHYLGNNGTTNYRLILSWPHVCGAASIAVGACLISFGLFFHWSGHWVNFIWRRVVVACFLACAVSGMHWTAAAGTWYELQGYHYGRSRQSRNTNLIIALCLCLSACVVCFLLGFLKQRQQRMLKDRAQQVVLAVATFDADGKLLVSQGGLMPCQTITRQFQRRTFDDEFNTSHPVFHWLFRVSRNWTGVADLIPSMRENLQATGYIQSTSSPTQPMDSRNSLNSDNNANYSTTFRELFCVTAQEIARSLDTSLQNLGTLFEDVLTTGTLLNRMTYYTSSGHKKAILATDVATTTKDVEASHASPILFGKGQLLLLARRVDASEALRLQKLGYRFANMEQVGDQLARSLQVAREDLENLVERLDSFSKREPAIPSKGAYLASFLIQPSPAMKGLDVVVPRSTPDRLPMVKLSDGALLRHETKLLATFNGLSLDDCLTRLSQRTLMGSHEDMFLDHFRNRIHDLLRDCPETALNRAIFSACPLDIAHGTTGQEEMSPATIFAFCGIKEIYIQSLHSLTLKTIPLSLFQTYLRSYPGCPDHAILAQKNHKDFSSVGRVTTKEKLHASRNGSFWPSLLRSTPTSRPTERRAWQPDSSSEKGLVHGSSSQDPSHAWGSIMVTSTQNMTVDESIKEHAGMEMQELGVRSEIGMAETERPTLADRLMSITTGFRDPHAARALPKDIDLNYGPR
ncbi:hypothetical protein ACEQ8H_001521 [Pleosporales sp. CAS-2024a]